MHRRMVEVLTGEDALDYWTGLCMSKLDDAEVVAESQVFIGGQTGTKRKSP